MGRASRWIMNFLLGKKEDRQKNKLSYQRRWSFGRTSSKPKAAKDLALAATFYLPTTRVEDNAATKIQAAFRSYLAKKALCALRSLVKLQALVRGNLVRKQAASTVKRMHALMSIQVRARYHRLHITREPFSKNDSDIQHIDNELSTYFYRDDFSPTTSQTSSNTMITKSTSARASFGFHQFSQPNYMADTQSSRAKVARSQSEPKQRPVKSKATTNVQLQDGLVTQDQSRLRVQNNAALSRFIKKNPTRLLKLLPYTTNSYSSEYEPHITLY